MFSEKDTEKSVAKNAVPRDAYLALAFAWAVEWGLGTTEATLEVLHAWCLETIPKVTAPPPFFLSPRWVLPADL